MKNQRIFKLGTRSSPLALWQAGRVCTRLQELLPDKAIEIVKIQTVGDKILDKPMVQVGGKGIFTKEIEEALHRKDIDFAVHSFKDLPTVQPDGLGIVCIPERTTPFDALISQSGGTLKDLPENPTIATGSLRRRAQILNLRPDANVVDIRGNVNTRLRKYRESDWHGLIMAGAAIERMKWNDLKAVSLPSNEMLPAPAQGALAIEARLDDEETKALLQSIHSNDDAVGVTAERSFLAELEGGCQVPMAAHATIEDGTIILEGLVANLDGSSCIRKTTSGPLDNAQQIGQSLAEAILQSGGDQIIEELKAMNR